MYLSKLKIILFIISIFIMPLSVAEIPKSTTKTTTLSADDQIRVNNNTTTKNKEETIRVEKRNDAKKKADNERDDKIKKTDNERDDKIRKEDKKVANKKERREQCDKIIDSVKKLETTKADSIKKLDETIEKLDTQISKLEIQNTKKQEEFNRAISKLKVTSAQTIAEFKEALDTNLTGVDSEIERIEGTVFKYQETLNTIEEGRLDLFHQYREAQNARYSTCFDKSFTKVERSRIIYYQKLKQRTLNQKNLGTLFKGGKNKKFFSNQFNKELNLCLNNQIAASQKIQGKNLQTLKLKKLKYRKKQMQQQITKSQSKLKKLTSKNKVKIIKRFKIKMQNHTNAFSEEYNNLTFNYDNFTKNNLKEIGKMKKKQAELMNARAQKVMPKDKKSKEILMSEFCQKHNKKNILNKFKEEEEDDDDDDDDEDSGSTE